jgi:hypothetical protein
MHRPGLRPFLTCYAALLLAAQLVLTAGHLHLAAFHEGERLAVAASGFIQEHAPGQPSHHEDHCPLCWAQIAASASLIPPPTALPLPPANASLPSAPVVRQPAANLRSQAFQARAPPLALSA